jgi:hypothetical protein
VVYAEYITQNSCVSNVETIEGLFQAVILLGLKSSVAKSRNQTIEKPPQSMRAQNQYTRFLKYTTSRTVNKFHN